MTDLPHDDHIQVRDVTLTARTMRMMILVPPEMLAEIDEYPRTERDIPPRTEAIRRLIRAGLDAAKTERYMTDLPHDGYIRRGA